MCSIVKMLHVQQQAPHVVSDTFLYGAPDIIIVCVFAFTLALLVHVWCVSVDVNFPFFYFGSIFCVHRSFTIELIVTSKVVVNSAQHSATEYAGIPCYPHPSRDYFQHDTVYSPFYFLNCANQSQNKTTKISEVNNNNKK